MDRMHNLFIAISKIRLIMQNFLNLVVWRLRYWTVTNCPCDKLNVWRVGHVTSWLAALCRGSITDTINYSQIFIYAVNVYCMIVKVLANYQRTYHQSTMY